MKQIRDVFDTCTPTQEQIRRMAENIAAKSAGTPNRRPTARQAVSIAVAAALIITATVSAAAYAGPEIGTAVREFFTRRETLMAESGGLIEREVTAEGITLSVDGAVMDGDTTYLMCTMTNHEEDFAGQIFTADWVTLARKTARPVDGMCWYSNQIMHRQMGIAGIYAGDILKLLDGDSGNSFSFTLVVDWREMPEGEYTLTLSAPMIATTEMDGSITRHDLAEELSVTFPLGQLNDTKSVFEESPQTPIQLDCGGTLTLEYVRISPVEIKVRINDRGAEDVPAPNHPEILISPLDWVCCFVELKETGLISLEEWSKANDHHWQIFVTFRDGASRVDSANTYGSYNPTDNADGWRSMSYTFRLDSPVFPEDIEKISLVRGPGNAEEIVIWTPEG